MAAQHKTPVTMLSGFLGAGKTTLLRYLLENSTEKIACVVNDVASINIDAKLVRNDKNRAGAKADDGTGTTKDLADTVELQNGCACCNMQDELFASFEQILTMADNKGEPYARIVLENSGVAEPHAIRDKFSEAEAAGHPLLERIYLDTLVTVVDCSTFSKEYASLQPLAARPDLGDGGNMRPVVDLLVEQVECADYVVLNKTDLLPTTTTAAAASASSGSEGSESEADKAQQGNAAALQELTAIISSLNPLATVITCQQGKIPLQEVFGSNARGTVARLNVEGQHRGAVAAARTVEAAEHNKEEGQHHHHHHHENKPEHSHAADGEKHDDCAACTHEHNHAADGHKHDDCAACTHEHHHHEHNHAADGHTHDDCAACTHDHDHDHHHHHHHHDHKHKERPATRAAQRFGITSFVYSRRRPFHPQRLKELVLRWLPVATNKAIGDDAPQMGDSPIKAVLRSKGFIWMSNSHATAYYWSHAGQHFEIKDEGDWWAAVPDEDWPTEPEARNTILADWDLGADLHEGKGGSGKYGDRRQEIVCIGVGMNQEKICEQLDGALLTDDELAKYEARWAAVPDPVHPDVELLRQQAQAKKAKAADAGEHHEHHSHAH